MTDRTNADDAIAGLAGIPMQPSGSGVANLEVAYERTKLEEGVNPVDGNDEVSTAGGPGAAESEAHPS